MPSFLSSAAVLALTASLASAAPTSHRQGFSVARVRTGSTRSPVAKNYQAHAKYHVLAADSTTGSVSANPQPYDSEYLCSVQVGNNQLNLDFDTGSSDLWVFSSETPNPGSHNTYDTSSGQQESGETWSISYGDGSGASGNVFADTVVVGGATVTGQAVEAATSVSAEFQSGAGDGLLGLGYESGNTCSPNQCQTFFGNLMSNTPSPLFTADLQDNGGSYDFGYIDGSKYSGSITYTNVLQQNPSYWDFTAGGYSTGSQNSGASIGYAIMDTGTSLWYMPSQPVQDFYAAISSASDNSNDGGYVFQCGDSTIPSFSVDIGGTTFTVPASALGGEPLNDGSGNCFGGIQENSGFPGSIFGDVFMKNFFVVFDLGNNQLGVANQ